MFHPKFCFSSERLGSSSSPKSQFIGFLQDKDVSGKVVNSIALLAEKELIIGRNGKQCQYIVDDPAVSNKHLRIYSVAYDGGNPKGVVPLVYAEDLSRNGTFWNGSRIGKGSGGFLLSDGDTLRVSDGKVFVCRMNVPCDGNHLFDSVQEDEMNYFRKDYIVTDRLLGAGAYGRVHMAIEQSQRTQLACKIVDLRKLQTASDMRSGHWECPAPVEGGDRRLEHTTANSQGQKQAQHSRTEDRLTTCYREAEILASLNHPNIIGLDKVYLSNNSIYIFQELVTAGDLFSYIEHKNGKLLDVEAAVVVRQILIALEFLHEQNIVHRDLKPENILMTSLASGCRVVLTDFGCARRVGHQRRRMMTSMGTYEYSAPEMLREQNSNSNPGGYTKAVDLWSVGCITTVLLTGGYPFFEFGSADFSMKQAIRGNLDPLEQSETWKEVRARPQDFVRRLLVLDERQRMTAKGSLAHEWFMNNVHRVDFEQLYRRSIRHWRPRTPREPVVELIEPEKFNQLFSPRAVRPHNHNNAKGGTEPGDWPDTLFPHRLHNLAYFPGRTTLRFNNSMAEQVKAAAECNWNFEKRHSAALSNKKNGPPKPRILDVSKGSGNSFVREWKKSDLPLPSRPLPSLSNNPKSKPLWINCSLTPLDLSKPFENTSSEATARTAQSSCADLERRDIAPVRKAYSPTAWREEAEAMRAKLSGQAKTAIPNNQVITRIRNSLDGSHHGTKLLHRLRNTAKVSHSSQGLPGQSRKNQQFDKQVICLDEEDSLSDKDILREVSTSLSLDRQKRTNRPIQSSLEPPQYVSVLNSPPREGAESPPSCPYDPEALPADEEAPIYPTGPDFPSPGLTLKSPAHAVGGFPGAGSSNMKRRRSQFIFEFEEGPPTVPLGKARKLKLNQRT